jgi:septum formation protein
VPRLVLGSSSPYRAELLTRLGLPFDRTAPDIDETPAPGEPVPDYVERLAREKARAAAPGTSDTLTIGSDQAAALDGRWLRKPGTLEAAADQLAACSGRCVTFHTGVAVHDGTTGTVRSTVVPFRVHFRTLSDDAIRRYVNAERPLDSAGAFRVEGLGITLFSRLEGDDPNALVGLPLIALVDLLADAGLTLP